MPTDNPETIEEWLQQHACDPVLARLLILQLVTAFKLPDRGRTPSITHQIVRDLEQAVMGLKSGPHASPTIDVRCPSCSAFALIPIRFGNPLQTCCRQCGWEGPVS